MLRVLAEAEFASEKRGLVRLEGQRAKKWCGKVVWANSPRR